MNLNFYRKGPTNAFHITDIEQICKERIKLYTVFEEAKFNKHVEGTKHWSKYVKSRIRTLNLITYCTLMDIEWNPGLEESKEKDNTAHWLTGYCQTKKLQDLFIEWELQWFHLLFMNYEIFEIERFLEKNNSMCYTLTGIEVIIKSDELINFFEGEEVNRQNLLKTTFYKARFEEILEVVGRREAYLEFGNVFFLEKHLINYVQNKLRREFQARLKHQSKVLPVLEDRFKFLIQNIPKFIPRLILGTSVDGINLDNIDQIAENHFPLCMKHLHNTLRTNHHLKYDARMQYGVFLYWLGLSYEDTLQFWKDEFIQKMDANLFNRHYSYLFKHQYGLVGRKKPYEPFSCDKILSSSPLPIQYHGCPYKHWSKSYLLESIQDISCLKDIEDLVDQNKYQSACTKYLCCSRNVQQHTLNMESNFIVSPNQYVNESMSTCDILDTMFADTT